jgi:hypothetical protein
MFVGVYEPSLLALHENAAAHMDWLSHGIGHQLGHQMARHQSMDRPVHLISPVVSGFWVVIPLGLEPRTNGLKVPHGTVHGCPSWSKPGQVTRFFRTSLTTNVQSCPPGWLHNWLQIAPQMDAGKQRSRPIGPRLSVTRNGIPSATEGSLQTVDGTGGRAVHDGGRSVGALWPVTKSLQPRVLAPEPPGVWDRTPTRV